MEIRVQFWGRGRSLDTRARSPNWRAKPARWHLRGSIWHGRAIPGLGLPSYSRIRAVLGEGCPGVQRLERVRTPVNFCGYFCSESGLEA